MAETLLQYQTHIVRPGGEVYEARACAGRTPMGNWEGWIEFIPVIGGGPPVRSPRETTQPNRAAIEYWATGLTAVYLEGALGRALAGPHYVPPPVPPQPSIFSKPAPSNIPEQTSPAAPVPHDSVLDPFSVYMKGEALLRRQLGALSSWHLVNIALDYGFTDEPVEVLNQLSTKALIELIVAAVKTRS